MEQKISVHLTENRRWLQEQCRNCADVKFQTFYLGRGGEIAGFAVYLEIAVSNLMLEESMLGRMMMRLQSISQEEVRACLKKNEFGISDVYPVTTMEAVLAAVFAGDMVLLVDGFWHGLKIAGKGYPKRSVGSADLEKVLRGSNEAFTESVKENAALIRKRIRSSGLKIEEMTFGTRSKTLTMVLYMEDLEYPQILDELKQRLSVYEIDGVFDSGVLEQLAETHWLSPFPQFQTTERPDLAALELLEGRIVLLSDNSPMALLLPASLPDFLCVSEDRYNRFAVASFQRLIRYTSMILTVMISGTYLAVTGFGTRIVPTNLLLSFAEARRGVPFPGLLEILFMELAFELIREAGVRMPGPLSGTIGIVGGLIIGDAAVSANLVSPMAVVVVAISAISSFAVPNEEFASAFRLLKYGFIFAGGFFGIFGIVCACFLLLGHLAGMESFGIPYLLASGGKHVYPYHSSRDGLLRAPLRRMKYRPVTARREQRIRLAKKKGKES